MAKKDQYTAEQMIDALRATNGMKTVAARRLGCAYNTIVRYIETYPTVKAALNETKESMGDRIESTLLATALGERDSDGGWKTEPNVSALIFIAKTHPVMRERGYGEHIKLDVDIKIVAEAIAAIEKLGQNPAEVFNRIIQRAALTDGSDD